MKTVTTEDIFRFVSILDRVFDTEEWGEKLKKQLAQDHDMRKNWPALDVLRLEDVPAASKLRLVLWSNAIEFPIRNEFACRCAERALSALPSPDRKCISAIKIKREWLRGECNDDKLKSAYRLVDAAQKDAIWNATAAAAESAVCAVKMDEESAHSFSWGAALRAAWCASFLRPAFWSWHTSMKAEREWQVAELMRMLEGEQE